jgi:hypothetical protein
MKYIINKILKYARLPGPVSRSLSEGRPFSRSFNAGRPVSRSFNEGRGEALKRFSIYIVSACLLISTPQFEAKAQTPFAEIIKQGIKKIIKAIDLMIQRIQNKTIWLQNAQKVLENKLSQLKLSEIAQWTEKQRTLYKEYFDELRKVKVAISTYKRVRLILDRQKQMIQECAFMRSMIQQDNHFTRQEIEFMLRVYTGMAEESIHNLEQLLLVINAFKVQLSDGKRLELINKAGDSIDKTCTDLQQFNAQNIQLSLNRAKDAHEIESVKKLYGLN